MCGIGGIVSINNSVIDQKISDDIKNSLNHRGPDHSLTKNINQDRHKNSINAYRNIIGLTFDWENIDDYFEEMCKIILKK